MHNAIYSFLNFTSPIGKKTKIYFPIKKNHIFKTKNLPSPAKIRFSSLISKNILKLVIPDTRSILQISQNYKYFPIQ